MGGSPIAPRAGLVTLATFDMVLQTTGQPMTAKQGAGPQTFTPFVALIITADKSNAATDNYGMGGSASSPLVAGASDAFDIPYPYYGDLSQLTFSGTAADIFHVKAFVPQSLDE